MTERDFLDWLQGKGTWDVLVYMLSRLSPVLWLELNEEQREVFSQAAAVMLGNPAPLLSQDDAELSLIDALRSGVREGIGR
jgi:hypothetical protein